MLNVARTGTTVMDVAVQYGIEKEEMARRRYSRPKPQTTIHVSVDAIEFIDGHKKRRAEPNYEVLDRIIAQYEMQVERIAAQDFIISDLHNTIDMLRENKTEPEIEKQQQTVVTSIVGSNIQEQSTEQQVVVPTEEPDNVQDDSIEQEQSQEQQIPSQRTQAERILKQHSLSQQSVAEEK